MTFQRRLKFYLGGVGVSSLLVLFFLSQKMTHCAYFPNDRVIAESLTKKMVFSDEFKKEMARVHLSDSTFIKHLFPKGNIDFKKSKVDLQPCPTYFMILQDSGYQIEFEKCKEQVLFKQLKSS